MLAPQNILERTFRIRYKEAKGTCFTIDEGYRQYIITASHVVASISNQTTVEIWHESRWKKLLVNLVGHGPKGVDITVLITNIFLSPTQTLPLPVATEVLPGQDIQFLGFPYGLKNEVGPINRNFPLPLVKHGIISAVLPFEKTSLLLLDGHNNPGFSGGPVVCEIANSQNNGLGVIGVISSYKYEHEPIYEGQSETPFSYKDNTGIIFACNIRHALDLIRKNPTGANLPTP